MKADEEDKLFHTDGAWWTFLKSGKWNGENDYTLFVEYTWRYLEMQRMGNLENSIFNYCRTRRKVQAKVGSHY